MPHTNVDELRRITAAHQAELRRAAQEQDKNTAEHAKDTAQALRTVADWSGLANENLSRLAVSQRNIINYTLADKEQGPARPRPNVPTEGIVGDLYRALSDAESNLTHALRRMTTAERQVLAEMLAVADCRDD